MRLDLIPTSALYALAKVGAFGAKKYSDENWRGGYKHSIPYTAALRHLFKYRDGEDLDDESGCEHLWHALFNIAILIELQYTKPEFDDRPAKKYKIRTYKDMK